MLLTFGETEKLIKEGRILHLAGDESLLSRLPAGKWIGGTTPYFITNAGGVMTKDKLFADELNDAVDMNICVADAENVFDFVKGAYENGLTLLLMPYRSGAAKKYAKEAPEHFEILMNPTVGWIAGFDLDCDSSAAVIDGSTGKKYTDSAVAMHIKLPEGKFASIGTVNIFEADVRNDVITFDKDALELTNCRIDGKNVLFADYIAKCRIDTQMPLVADYNGVNVNVSIMSIDAKTKYVSFYAPVFAGVEYRFASKITDYTAEFRNRLRYLSECAPMFSCNCILNYLYGSLNGKATPPFEGPVTFGEIAYQLLNQTLVYAEIKSK